MLNIHMIEIMAPAWLRTCSLFRVLKYRSAPGILPLQLTHCERDNCTTRAWVLSCVVTGRSFCLFVRPRRYLTPQRLSRECMRCANLVRGTSKSNTVEVLHSLLLKQTRFVYKLQCLTITMSMSYKQNVLQLQCPQLLGLFTLHGGDFANVGLCVFWEETLSNIYYKNIEIVKHTKHVQS